MNDDTKSESLRQEPESENEGSSRRDFLLSLGKWSAAVVGGVLMLGTNESASAGGAWVNRRGAGGAGWANRAAGGGAWVNGAGGGGAGWVNRAVGGGAWVNGAGGGGGAWVNRRGAGGAGWVNR